jgi:uncharacterized membrane protein YccC
VRRLFLPGALFTVAAVLLGTLILGGVFWSFDTDPMWAIISFVLVYDPDARGMVIRAGVERLLLTILGSVIAMAAVFAFGLHKWLLPLSLAITACLCGTFLRSRAGWRVALVTVALIVGSSLLQSSAGSYIAVVRSIEVSAGSLLAIVFSLGVGRLESARGTSGR